MRAFQEASARGGRVRLQLATCPDLMPCFHDDKALPHAFAEHGVTATPTAWQRAAPDQPVLLRSIWDYTLHLDAFNAWLDALDAAGTPCINPTSLVRWNLDKRYLLELERKGHTIVPTEVHASFDPEQIAGTARKKGWQEAIAKPVQGAGAEGLVRIQPDGTYTTFDAAGNTWGSDWSPTPKGACLVQPFLPEIAQGEWSLFYFGGEYSHAILKTPAAHDIRVQEEHGGQTCAATPPDDVQQRATRIMADVPDAVYGRVDGVVVDGAFQLMELELIEPELYFRTTRGAEERFARAVVAALKAS